MPTGFIAAIPAGALLVDLVKAVREGELHGRAKLIALVLAVPAFQHLGADVVYFMPELQPKLERLSNGEQPPITGTGYPPHTTLRYTHDVFDQQLVEFIREHDEGTGRWLVERPPLGDDISWRTDAQVMGGFTFRNLEHSWANLYRRRPQGIVKPKPLRRYFRKYAIEWVVVSHPGAWFVRVPNPQLELVEVIGPHHIFRTKVQVNLVAKGGGEVEAETNLLRVTGSDPDADVVLRYHWLETLVCRPDCAIERRPIDKVDKVGTPSLPGQPIDVSSSPRSEAFDALVALGYKPNEVNKLLGKLDIDDLSAEDIIRKALKQAAA